MGHSVDRESVYLIGLSRLPGVGPSRLTALYERFGSFTRAWRAADDQLRECGINEYARCLIRRQDSAILNKEYDQMLSAGIVPVVRGGRHYPSRLLRLTRPPWVLYTKGQLRSDLRYIATVGSRRPTKYGIRLARDISRQLTVCGYGVVSGLARGIDSVCHRAALEHIGVTVAVLGWGIDYQPNNRKQTRLIKDIIQSGGALVSEYGPGIEPVPGLFLQRNRLVAGLADAVVIFEAGRKSGTKNTASWAKKIDVPVCVFPGSVLSDSSAGCHDLIKQGAHLVTGAGDILGRIGQI